MPPLGFLRKFGPSMGKHSLLLSVIGVFAAGVGSLLPLAPAARAADPIQILAVHFPPYEIKDPEDDLPGFDVEVLTSAFKRVNRKASVEFLPWKRAVHLAEQGNAAGVLSCAYNAGREKNFIFSDVLSQATRGFYVHPDFDATGPVNVDFAKGYSVTAVSGYVSAKTLTEHKVSFDPSPTDIAAIRKLINRRVEMFYTSQEAADYIGRSDNLANRMKFLPVKVIPYYVCFSRKWPDVEKLVKDFNRGLRILRQDGQYQKIHAKYSARTS